MRRIERDLEVVVPGLSAAEVRATLDGATGFVKGSRAGLVVRRTGDGGYRMHRPEGRYAGEPVFRAHVADGPDGAVLTGRAAETRESRMSDDLMAASAVMTGAFAVFCAVARIWIGLGICGVAAVLFTLISVVGGWGRTPAFEAGLGRLRDALHQQLRGAAATPGLPSDGQR